MSGRETNFVSTSVEQGLTGVDCMRGPALLNRHSLYSVTDITLACRQLTYRVAGPQHLQGACGVVQTAGNSTISV